DADVRAQRQYLCGAGWWGHPRGFFELLRGGLEPFFIFDRIWHSDEPVALAFHDRVGTRQGILLIGMLGQIIVELLLGQARGIKARADRARRIAVERLVL